MFEFKSIIFLKNKRHISHKISQISPKFNQNLATMSANLHRKDKK